MFDACISLPVHISDIADVNLLRCANVLLLRAKSQGIGMRRFLRLIERAKPGDLARVALDSGLCIAPLAHRQGRLSVVPENQLWQMPQLNASILERARAGPAVQRPFLTPMKVPPES
jgi:hypothetical protein